jgi:hypothetical protein
MAKTVVAVFNTYTEAESAVHQLTANGLRAEDISVVATDRTRNRGSALAVNETENVSSGAGTGAAVGGAAGLMLGIAALAIPGIGPIVAAGPIAAALTGAGLGAAAGGMIGGLAKIGVPEEHAHRYQEVVRRGGTLIAVHASDDDAGRIETLLNRHGAVDVEEKPQGGRVGVSSSDPHNQAQSFGQEGRPAEPNPAVPSSNLATGRNNVRFYDPDQSAAPDLADPTLREVYETAWRARWSWEDFSDAWRFGSSLAANARYASAEWSDVEGDARRHWESTRPNTWDKANDVVRRAWDHVRGAAQRDRGPRV